MNVRLEKIVEHINNGLGVIDVGTDHGYIPLYLAHNGYNGGIYASDINEGPLKSAMRNAAEEGLERRIKFLLCDGLALCPPDKVDTIVIAGMGGDTICGILDSAEWCMDAKYRLILQPMTKAEILRYWLANNGFELTDEEFVADNGIDYQIICARYGKNTLISDAELFVGRLENIKKDPLAKRAVDTFIKRFSYELDGMGRSANPNSGRIKLCTGILTGLEEMRDVL